MRSKRGPFFFLLIVLFIAATLQSTGLLAIFGVKPNLMLVLLATFVFFVPHLFLYGILALCAAGFISFTPGINWESGALLIIALVFFYVRDRFLVAGLFANVVFIVLGTIAFYLFISPGLLYHEAGVALKEIVYNALLGAVLFGVTRFIYEKKGGTGIR